MTDAKPDDRDPPADLSHAGAVVDKAIETTVRFVGGALLALPAVHRVQETVSLSLVDVDFRATLSLALRL